MPSNASLDGTDSQRGQGHLSSRLKLEVSKLCDGVVEWFEGNMPKEYFQDVDEDTQLSHLKALIALRSTGYSQNLSLVNNDKTVFTHLCSSPYTGLLSDVVDKLPTLDQFLREASIYTSADKRLALDVFEFEKSLKGTSGFASPRLGRWNSLKSEGTSGVGSTDTVASLRGAIEAITTHLPHLKPEAISLFVERSCDNKYLLSVSPETIAEHIRLIAKRRIGSSVQILREGDQELSVIYVARPAEYKDLFSRLVKHMRRLSLDIDKARVNRLQVDDMVWCALQGGTCDTDSASEGLTLLQDTLVVTFRVRLKPGEILTQQLSDRINDDLERLHWTDSTVLDFLDANPDSTLEDAELIVGLCELLRALYASQYPFTYTLENLLRFVRENWEIATSIIEKFKRKFSPGGHMGNHISQQWENDLKGQIENQVELEGPQGFFLNLLKVLTHSLKTNRLIEGRLCLALRLHPALFAGENQPFGVCFAFGRGFIGFHCRYRDIARGGIRILVTRSPEQYIIANRGLVQECFGLASAQQLKNKDIPEGGSKGVILLNPGLHASAAFRAFTDGLLDLTVPDHAASGVDYYGQPELLYLGPDENVSNDMIEWICHRARERGHPYPATFMSSKPGAGINHKEYGVTSEGVTVFLDVLLRHQLGLDPRTESFTVKITGGPDGDVAGNEIKILSREYGENAKIVAIADGSGTLEDPDGLDHEELLRLVELGEMVHSFHVEKLGSRGRLTTIHEEDGVRLRNSMHFRVESLVFIPAGGRPNTVNDNNWREFFREDPVRGLVPSSRLVVEGANLFFTAHARQCISRQGVAVVKDSSANKCGVICSSFEILAGMLVPEETFLGIKDAYVKVVLERLKALAELEAKLLLKEMKASRGHQSLPEISISVSKIMIGLRDSVEDFLTWSGSVQYENDAFLKSLILDHVPALLVEKAGGIGGVIGRLPRAYVLRLVAMTVASRVVYQEGTEFVAFAQRLINSKSRPARAVHDNRPDKSLAKPSPQTPPSSRGATASISPASASLFSFLASKDSAGNLALHTPSLKHATLGQQQHLGRIAIQYLRESQGTGRLLERLNTVDGLSDRDRALVLNVLKDCGTRKVVEDWWNSEHKPT